MTDDEILEQIRADWQQTIISFFKKYQRGALDALDKETPEPDNYPWTMEDLFTREIDIKNICFRMQSVFQDETDHLTVDDWKYPRLECPSQKEIEALIQEWLKDDPAILLAVGKFPMVFDRLRLWKIKALQAVRPQIEKALAVASVVALPGDAPNMIDAHFSLGRASIGGALRRTDLYQEYLESIKPSFSPSDQKSGKFPKTAKGKSTDNLEWSHYVVHDGEWTQLEEQTHDFFVRHGAHAGNPENVSIHACRLTAHFLQILFPEIEFFSCPIKELAERIRNKLRSKRDEK